MRETKMKSTLRIMTSAKFTLIASAIVSFWLLGFGLHAATPSKSDAASAAQPGQKQFDTPKQAADALIQVAANFDVAATKEILGPDGEDIISSEDPVMDKNRALALPRQRKRARLKSTRKIRTAPFSWWATMIFRFPSRS